MQMPLQMLCLMRTKTIRNGLRTQSEKCLMRLSGAGIVNIDQRRQNRQRHTDFPLSFQKGADARASVTMDFTHGIRQTTGSALMRR